jgi:hypothetical protein
MRSRGTRTLFGLTGCGVCRSMETVGQCTKTELLQKAVAKRLRQRIFILPLESSVANFIYHSLARTVGGLTTTCAMNIYLSPNQTRAVAPNLYLYDVPSFVLSSPFWTQWFLSRTAR